MVLKVLKVPTHKTTSLILLAPWLTHAQDHILVKLRTRPLDLSETFSSLQILIKAHPGFRHVNDWQIHV